MEQIKDVVEISDAEKKYVKRFKELNLDQTDVNAARAAWLEEQSRLVESVNTGEDKSRMGPRGITFAEQVEA